MDPLSLAASIIAVVEVSHALLICCYGLKGKVQGADDEIASIIKEVEDVSGILSELELIIKSMAEDDTPYDVPWPPPWLPSVDACATILVEIRSKIEPFSKPSFRLRMKWTLVSKNIEAKLKLLDKNKSTLHLALATLELRVSSQVRSRVVQIQSTLNGVGTAVLQGQSHVVESVDGLQSQSKRASILRWFKTSDPEQNYKVSKKKHEPETSGWIFNNTAYQAWESKEGHESRSLWLHGIPGAGKTILSSMIISRLQQLYGGDSSTRVIYYYFDFSDNKKQTVLSLLQSLIYQLICNNESMSQATLGLFEQNMNGAEQPTIDDLLELLRVEISDTDATYLVIDSLDECPSEQRESFFDNFLDGAFPLNLHILITSRCERDIEEALADNFSDTISIQSADIDADVRIHIGKEILRDRNLKKWKPAIQQEILEAIVKGSGGMFRWAVCQLDTLKKCLTPAMVRAELKKMPQTLHQTYDRMLLGIDELHQPYVQSALRWLAFSMRPLSLPELSEAVVVDLSETTFEPESVRLNDDTKILELCGALVTASRLEHDHAYNWISDTYRSELGYGFYNPFKDGSHITTVSLSHYSVKEYIRSQQALNTRLSDYHISASLANTYLASSCLLYLLSYSPSQEHRGINFGEYPLAGYCARYWIDHWKLSHGGGDNEGSLLYCLLRRFFDPKNTTPYRNWHGIWDPDQFAHFSRGTVPARKLLRTALEKAKQPLYRAAALGDPSLVRELVAKGNDPAAREGLFDSPMNAAAFYGHLDIVNFFLEKGISPNLAGSRFASVLHAAAAGGSVSVVERLIEAGADVNTRGGEFNSALVAAAGRKHDKVVACLLRHGADINATSRAHGSSLYQAAKTGDQNTVVMLLAAGADVNEIGDSEGTPLYGAAESGSVDLIRILLQKGADVNKGSDRADYGYPVAAAAEKKELPVVKALLRAGANVNVPPRGSRGVSVLEAAIEGRDLATFCAVLDAGADPNVQGNHYMNAFHATTYTGNMDMARLLLERGAEVEDEGFLFALSRYSVHPWILNEILRTRDPDVDAFGHYNTSAMHCAIGGGGEKVARLLLERRPYLDTVNEGGTILTKAIRCKMTDLAKDIINLGADVNLTVNTNSPPFAHAAALASEDGNFELMDLLLSKGADTSDAVMEVVEYAAHGDEPADGYVKLAAVLQYLVKHGACLDTVKEGDDSCSPLQLSASLNRLGLVKVLLDTGADINGPPGEDGSALHYALYSRERTLVEFFLANGAWVNDSVPSHGILAKAIRMGLHDMVPLLLEKGANLNETENEASPLSAAFRRGHKDLAKFLFDKGARFSETDASLLLQFVSKGNMEDLRELLEYYGMDPNVHGRYRFPLEDAVRSGRMNIVLLLQEHGADFRNLVTGSPGPLRRAIDRNDLEMVTWLLDAGADLTYHIGDNYQPLYFALTKSVDMVDLLLRRGAVITPDVWQGSVWGGEVLISRLLEEPASPSERRNNLSNALQGAAHQANYGLCLWLLSKGASLSIRTGKWGTPLQAALANTSIYQPTEANNRNLTVELFIARGADVNAPAYAIGEKNTIEPPLLLTARLQVPKLVKLLLAAGADVNLTGGDLHSPLQAAARYCPTMVPELLSKGATVSLVGGNRYGSALHAAGFMHDEETVKLLLQHGADVHVVAGKYGSVLQAAAKVNSGSGDWTDGLKSVRVMKLLLEAGADVNAPGGKFGNALQMAAKSGNLAGVKWLLANGADIQARGGKYGSAKEAALKKCKWSVLSYLWKVYGRD